MHLGHPQAFHAKAAESIPQAWLPKAPAPRRTPKTPQSEVPVSYCRCPQGFGKSQSTTCTWARRRDARDFRHLFGGVGSVLYGISPGFPARSQWLPILDPDVRARTLPPPWRRSKPSSGNGPAAQMSRCGRVAVARSRI